MKPGDMVVSPVDRTCRCYMMPGVDTIVIKQGVVGLVVSASNLTVPHGDGVWQKFLVYVEGRLLTSFSWYWDHI